MALADNLSRNSSYSFNTDVLRKAHESPARPDEMYYQLPKHLFSSSALLHLNIFITIWIAGDFPIIPIPGKEPTNPTSCVTSFILLITLFSVKINSITQCLKPNVDCSLYVDDFQICLRSFNMSIIERQL